MSNFHESVNAVSELIKSGDIEVTITNMKVVFKGKTYPHKDFLKSAFRCRWDGKNKQWVATNLTDTELDLVKDMAGLLDD